MVIDQADELGMVVILGYFYFGQDQRFTDEAAVIAASDAATRWIFDKGYTNVLVEINNECNVRYDHAILQPDRVHEVDRTREADRTRWAAAAGRHELWRRHDTRGKRRAGVGLPTDSRQRR